MVSYFQKFQVKMTVTNKQNKQDALVVKTRNISPFQKFSVFQVNAMPQSEPKSNFVAKSPAVVGVSAKSTAQIAAKIAHLRGIDL